jgi:ribosome modulation factor
MLARDADLDEFPLLNEPSVMLVALRTADRGPAGPDDCLKQIQASLRQAGLDLPPDTGPVWRRIETSYRYLHIARLVERGHDGRFLITPRGRETLNAYPKGIDASVLVKFPEFRSFIRQPRNDNDGAHLREPMKEYEEGYIAGLAGRLITNNPYSSDQIAHLEWENGWCEALDEIDQVEEA